MQKKSILRNKKQQNAVQTLSAESNLETLQRDKLENTKTLRAKFVCNSQLAEMIVKANLLPANFDFDWKSEESEKGKLAAIEEWRKILLFELPKETRIYLLANRTFRPKIANTTNTIEYGEKDKGKSFDRTVLALLLLQELLEIKAFLQSLVKLSAVFEFAIKNNFVTSETTNILHLLSFIHTKTPLLLKHSVTQKFAKINAEDYKDLPETIKTGVMIEELAWWISSTDNLEQFGITESERADFLVFYFESLSEFILKKNKDELDDLVDNIRSFVENVKTVSSKVLATEIIIDGKGQVKFQLSPYAQALQGVNISRLRNCEICEKFFWALRKDAFTCSKQHAKTRRMRLLRKNWKESGELYLKARRKKNEKNSQEK